MTSWIHFQAMGAPALTNAQKLTHRDDPANTRVTGCAFVRLKCRNSGTHATVTRQHGELYKAGGNVVGLGKIDIKTAI
jgi:hypothetical protein